MNLLFRIMLAIYAFFLTIVSFIAILISINPKYLDMIYKFLGSNYLQHWNAGRIIILLVSLIFFVLSVTFLMSGVSSGKDKKSISKFSNIGEIKISLDSVESIALGASRRLTGVRDTKAYVTKLGESVTIAIKAVFMADVNIPNISEDIQVKVKNSVEQTTGINVNDVRVIVDNIYTGYKSRVE